MRFQLVFHPFPELSCPKPHCKQCVFLLCAPSRHPSRPPLGSLDQAVGALAHVCFLADGFTCLPRGSRCPGQSALATASPEPWRPPRAPDQRLFSEGPAKERTGRRGEPPPTIRQEGPEGPGRGGWAARCGGPDPRGKGEGRQDRGPPRSSSACPSWPSRALRAPGSTTAESKGKTRRHHCR